MVEVRHLTHSLETVVEMFLSIERENTQTEFLLNISLEKFTQLRSLLLVVTSSKTKWGDGPSNTGCFPRDVLQHFCDSDSPYRVLNLCRDDVCEFLVAQDIRSD